MTGPPNNTQLPEFSAALQNLYYSAGAPAMRDVAQAAGGNTSPSTAHRILVHRRVGRWPSVERIVRALGGVPADFEALWRASSSARGARRTAGQVLRPAAGHDVYVLTPATVGRMIRAGRAVLAAPLPAGGRITWDAAAGADEDLADRVARAVVRAAAAELLIPGEEPAPE